MKTGRTFRLCPEEIEFVAASAIRHELSKTSTNSQSLACELDGEQAAYRDKARVRKCHSRENA